jgi:hypothetical protein
VAENIIIVNEKERNSMSTAPALKNLSQAAACRELSAGLSREVCFASMNGSSAAAYGRFAPILLI